MERASYYSTDMNIHYQVEGNGPVLVCLHGGKGNSGDYFIPSLSPLATEMKLVYLDERGSGRSKPVPDKARVSFEGMAEDIENLAGHLGVKQIGLLGHSYGAHLATYYTLRHPERVRELYLVAGGVTRRDLFKKFWPDFYDQQMESLGLTQKIKEVRDLYDAGRISADESFRRIVRAQVPAIFYHWRERQDIIDDVLARTDFTHIGPENSNFGDTEEVLRDMLNRLGEIRCPVLILPGQYDISWPLENLGVLARAIQDCEVRVIPRSRHFPYIDEPELFCSAVQEFHRRRVNPQ